MVSSCSRLHTQFAVLPPRGVLVPDAFQKVDVNNRRHDELLSQMQRLRGKAYLEDGAIRQSELTWDGRHRLSLDDESWHVLSLDRDSQVVACLRYAEERQAKGFDDLWVRHAALAQCPVLGAKFRSAVEREMQRAKRLRLGFGEVGGWAVAEDHRWTVEPLRIILATYGLLQLLGGCTGVATATARHGSASILRRIGLSSLVADGQELPPYYDPNYSCQMEVLQFDSRFPNHKYCGNVTELSKHLTTSTVICPERIGPWRRVFRGSDVQSLAAPLPSSFAVA